MRSQMNCAFMVYKISYDSVLSSSQLLSNMLSTFTSRYLIALYVCTQSLMQIRQPKDGNYKTDTHKHGFIW